jgi:hypothetical protein
MNESREIQKEPGAYTSAELARRCGMSEKFIVNNRKRIPGAFRAGRFWRFDKRSIEVAIQVKGKLF